MGRGSGVCHCVQCTWSGWSSVRKTSGKGTQEAMPQEVTSLPLWWANQNLEPCWLGTHISELAQPAYFSRCSPAASQLDRFQATGSRVKASSTSGVVGSALTLMSLGTILEDPKGDQHNPTHWIPPWRAPDLSCVCNWGKPFHGILISLCSEESFCYLLLFPRLTLPPLSHPSEMSEVRIFSAWSFCVSKISDKWNAHLLKPHTHERRLCVLSAVEQQHRPGPICCQYSRPLVMTATNVPRHSPLHANRKSHN